MRHFFAFCSLFLSLSTLAQNPKTQFLILGTAHLFADATINTPSRQREIQAIVNQLARFKPTKIFVEVQEAHQPYIDSLDRANQRTTQFTATLPNEFVQYGLRLAHQLKLVKGVVAVDWRPPGPEIIRPPTALDQAYSNYAALVIDLAKKASFSPATDGATKDVLQWTSTYSSQHSKRPLKQSLSMGNSKQGRKNMFYANNMQDVDGYLLSVGAELGDRHMLRNLHIYQNMVKHLTAQDQRCVVIYGLSHVYLLWSLLEANPRIELRELDTILHE